MSIRGERLGQKMAAEVRDLIYQPRLQREIATGLEHMHLVNQAHLLMLERRGLISRYAAGILAQGLLELERLGPAALPNDPSLEDLYFNYETALISQVGVEAGGSLHIGRSRNDIGATIDRMRARRHVLDLMAKVNDVRQTLLDQAQRYATTVMPGYTHLQPSQPITFGFYLLGPATALAREAKRLLCEYDRLNVSPLGAGAMAGTSFPIDRALTADLLGFAGITDHSQDAVASRDYMISLGAIAVSLAILWSRIAQDFYVWSTAEFGLIDFPDAVAGVSSIMPQKKNPVVIEALKANSGEIIGSFTAIIATMRASHFTHSIDATRSSLNGAWTLLDLCHSSITLLHLLVRTVTPREERMLTLSAANFSTMTDLADLITNRCGLSFREAHHVAGLLARRAMLENKSARELTAEMVNDAMLETARRSVPLDREEISQSLDPAISVERRISTGGPTAREIARMIAEQSAQLDMDGRTITQASEALSAKSDALRRAIRGLVPSPIPVRS